MLSIDFETYSAVKIQTAGMHRYIWDSSFEILCLAWSIDFEEPQLWTPYMELPPRLVAAFKDPNQIISGFNVGFEREVIKRCYKQLGLESPPPITRYLDTMALSCTYSYPHSLDNSASALGVKHLKDKRGKYLINKLCKPKKWSKSTPFTRWTPELAPADFNDLYEYCKQDVRAEQDVLRSLPRQTLTDSEIRVWRHTLIQNDRGVHIDYPLVDSILEVLGLWKIDLLKELGELTRGEITTGGQTARMKDYAIARGYEVKDMTADTVIKTLVDPLAPQEVKDLFKYRQLLSKTSTAKFTKMINARCADDTVKGNLYYWGAITGRYGGRGLQVQNLPRRKEKDPSNLIDAFTAGYKTVKAEFGNNLMEQASKLVRPCIIPPPGEDLYVSDYSSIENRALHWCAGDEITLEEFRQGLDQYITFAASQLHKPYELINDQERFRGKVAILGLGYQMGWKTYVATCAGYGLEMPEAESKETVNFYRRKYYLVSDLWYKLYKAAKLCVEMGRPTQYLKARFAVVKDHLFMKLPSGRCLCYPSPRMISDVMPWGETKQVISFMGVNPYSKKWMRLKITPGRLTENLVQAAARDILVEGAINIERAGYKVIASVHDEVIARAPEGYGSMEEFNKLMCDMPEWADGLPLQAVGYIGKRYKKD